MMSEETRKALEESIQHWEENLEAAKAGEKFNFYSEDCALCSLFEGDDCEGCPVAEKACDVQCEGSPWVDVNRVYWKWVRAGLPQTQYYLSALEEAVQQELDFLKSLLPNLDFPAFQEENDR